MLARDNAAQNQNQRQNKTNKTCFRTRRAQCPLWTSATHIQTNPYLGCGVDCALTHNIPTNNIYINFHKLCIYERKSDVDGKVVVMGIVNGIEV